MSYLFLRLIPKNLISRIAGFLADLEVPSPFLLSFIRIYAHIYKVRLDEMETPLKRMKSFNQFFTRRLKSGVRPIDIRPKCLVSPVDGTVAELGDIKHGLLVQTKGIQYSLADLIGDKAAGLYQDGQFLTIYLSPADYHRIHSPVDGKVGSFSYFSGNLWPVNKLGVEKVGGLFSLNERIVTPLEGEYGSISLVKVGATVVGKISVDYNSLKSNQGHSTETYLPVVPSRQYKKGDEIGRFQLGSTVILLFQKNQVDFHELFRGKKVKMGTAIGFLRK